MNGRRLSVLSVLSVASGTLTAQANQCPDPPRLPAYSHNDYYNRHPLLDAIALGYRGVEADYIVSDGELLVAHSRRIRAFNVPLHPAVYQVLFDAGVDLIGTKDLKETYEMLRSIRRTDGPPWP